VLSGPTVLQQSALDAVSQWRYRPYLLNGQPVEVETTVNVIFTLAN
jgi:protein TonB